MGSQGVTQAIVVDQPALNPNHSALQLALFNPDGTPFVVVQNPPDPDQPNMVLDGGSP